VDKLLLLLHLPAINDREEGVDGLVLLDKLTLLLNDLGPHDKQEVVVAHVTFLHDLLVAHQIVLLFECVKLQIVEAGLLVCTRYLELLLTVDVARQQQRQHTFVVL
jgi:hypothetical protein